MTGNDKTTFSDQAFWDRVQTSPERPLATSERVGDEEVEVADALDQLVRYRRTIGDPESSPPVGLTRRMASLFGDVRPDLVIRRQPLSSLIDRAAGGVQRLTASMVIDTGTLVGGIAGLRAAADRRTRQVAFVSEVADLDLELTMMESAGMPWAVTGQLGMSTVPPEQTIWFVPAGQVPVSGDLEPRAVDEAVQAPVNPDGYFKVSLIAGDWVGFVEVGDAVVLFREIRV